MTSLRKLDKLNSGSDEFLSSVVRFLCILKAALDEQDSQHFSHILLGAISEIVLYFLPRTWLVTVSYDLVALRLESLTPSYYNLTCVKVFYKPFLGYVTYATNKYASDLACCNFFLRTFQCET